MQRWRIIIDIYKIDRNAADIDISCVLSAFHNNNWYIFSWIGWEKVYTNARIGLHQLTEMLERTNTLTKESTKAVLILEYFIALFELW